MNNQYHNVIWNSATLRRINIIRHLKCKDSSQQVAQNDRIITGVGMRFFAYDSE